MDPSEFLSRTVLCLLEERTEQVHHAAILNHSAAGAYPARPQERNILIRSGGKQKEEENNEGQSQGNIEAPMFCIMTSFSESESLIRMREKLQGGLWTVTVYGLGI